MLTVIPPVPRLRESHCLKPPPEDCATGLMTRARHRGAGVPVEVDEVRKADVAQSAISFVVAAVSVGAVGVGLGAWLVLEAGLACAILPGGASGPFGTARWLALGTLIVGAFGSVSARLGAQLCGVGQREARVRTGEEMQRALLACGAKPNPAQPHKGGWERCPTDADDVRRNPDEAELVQHVQLEMRQLLEQANQHTQRSDPTSATILRELAGEIERDLSRPLDDANERSLRERWAWMHLKLYRMPADRAQRLSQNELAFLLSEFADDWERFKRRVRTHELPATDELRRWASVRMQTVYRTVSGMQKGHVALAKQLEWELSRLTAAERQELLSYKQRTLWALQTLGNGDFVGAEAADVEAMIAELGGAQGMAIAYLEQDANKTHYSCCIDGGAGNEFPLAGGVRRPRYRIELPGPPVLGDGKGDNQNCAIIYSRGHLLQAIDANQEGYVEEKLKMQAALNEFDDGADAPTILGFCEHIFSGLGALGEFAASSELAFGTVVQSTMASVLQSRFHYGHPDIFDKFAMMSQGGISKATKKLNVSEDVFAGMDAALRGHRIKHIEYMQVGKGRDVSVGPPPPSLRAHGNVAAVPGSRALPPGIRSGVRACAGRRAPADPSPSPPTKLRARSLARVSSISSRSRLRVAIAPRPPVDGAALDPHFLLQARLGHCRDDLLATGAPPRPAPRVCAPLWLLLLAHWLLRRAAPLLPRRLWPARSRLCRPAGPRLGAAAQHAGADRGK